MQGGCRATAEQQRWHNALSQIGCIATGAQQVQLHHCEGSCFKINKIPVGQWLVLPIHPALHDVSSNHELNVTHHKNAFHARYGSVDVLLMKARKRVLKLDPNATVIPEDILELTHKHYEPKEISDWYSILGIEQEQIKAA